MGGAGSAAERAWSGGGWSSSATTDAAASVEAGAGGSAASDAPRMPRIARSEALPDARGGDTGARGRTKRRGRRAASYRSHGGVVKIMSAG